MLAELYGIELSTLLFDRPYELKLTEGTGIVVSFHKARDGGSHFT